VTVYWLPYSLSGCSQKALVLMIMPINFFFTKNRIKSLFSELKLQVSFLFAQQSIWSIWSWQEQEKFEDTKVTIWWEDDDYDVCFVLTLICNFFFILQIGLGCDIYMDWLVYDAIFSHISALLCVLMGNMCLKPLLTIYMYTLIFRR